MYLLTAIGYFTKRKSVTLKKKGFFLFVTMTIQVSGVGRLSVLTQGTSGSSVSDINVGFRKTTGEKGLSNLK